MKLSLYLAGSALALGLFAFAAPASAALTTIDISTGLDSGGAVQTAGDKLDANWTVTGANNPENAPNAYTVFPDNADYYSGWLANDTHSDWIAANPNSASGNGLMTFTRTFDVGSTVGASLSGSWTVDDDGYVALNGNILSTLGSSNWGSMQTFSADASKFVSGLNTLVIQIGHTDNFLEAARLTGSATFEAPVGGVPEPSAWALMILGFGGAGALVRRQRRAGATA